ncbi:unnamed protein product [Nyctereutes procyonoides]|uniref:(raccoon dog) hypothetical protein n=1 Tax=Nyctereutes procyonoides TaxID=34880 RepID=A0A811ZR04_NYCPR|nr:unnamed protein product [Nyctereutes procyonoides]
MALNNVALPVHHGIGSGKKEKPMWELPIHKLCLSIFGVGEIGDRLTLATKFAVYYTFHGVKGKEILEKQLLQYWNLWFGDKDHINLGIKYDPSMDIHTLDFYVVLGRPRFSIIDKKHRVLWPNRISKEEAMHWFLQKNTIKLPNK